jgi:hypothetical protein
MMNGVYEIANPVDGKQPVHRGKYFEVYSANISTRYSEVYWTVQPTVPLPADFVAKFKGKIVSFTGYEVDSLRQMPDGTEEHVALYEAYDHHHNAYIVGSATEIVEVGPAGSKIAPSHGGVKAEWEPRHKPAPQGRDEPTLKAPDGTTIPAGAFMVDGNGGEYRMSMHAVGEGFGMLVQSPSGFSLQPMQINTKNPDKRGPGGPTPKNSKAPPGAVYSGLLECPCSDRKVFTYTDHSTRETGVCTTHVADPTGCFSAVAALGLSPLEKNITVNVDTAPAGCFVQATNTGYETYFNQAAGSKTTCGPVPGKASIRAVGNDETVGVGLKLDLMVSARAPKTTPSTTDLSGDWIYAGDDKQSPTPYLATMVRTGASSYKISVSPHAFKPTPATLDNHTRTFVMNGMSANISADWNTISFPNTASWHRASRAPPVANATISLTGPSGAWFGVGFDAENMGDAPYTIVVDGNGNVDERKLADHAAGEVLPPSLQVLSNTVSSDGIRTVVISRPLKGASPEYYTFNPAVSGVPYIAAVGASTDFAYHKARGGSTVFLVEVGAPMCICSDGKTGSINGVPFSTSRCLQSPPHSDLAHQKNPTCHIETYTGGLSCCTHKSILLDKDQEIPPAVDTYR